MGCSASKQTEWIQQIPPETPIYGAGCMFINDTHTLAGIHTPRRNHEVRICGFGGKAEGQEPWWQTAFRETIEEFFHVTSIPNTLLHALQSLQPIRILRAENPSYITLVYSFKQLSTFLKICASHITSPLYAKMPKTVEDLVFRRRYVGNAGTRVENGDKSRRFQSLAAQPDLKYDTNHGSPTAKAVGYSHNLSSFSSLAGTPPEIMQIVFWPLQNPYRRFRITKDFLSDMHALTV